MIRIPVPPEMLRWACERAGHEVEEIAERIPQLRAWIRGESRPTLKQLEKLAGLTRTPLGYLLLPEPPEESLPVPDYRTVSETATARPSPDLLDTLYTMQRRQAWLREALVEDGAEPLGFVGSARPRRRPGRGGPRDAACSRPRRRVGGRGAHLAGRRGRASSRNRAAACSGGDQRRGGQQHLSPAPRRRSFAALRSPIPTRR